MPSHSKEAKAERRQESKKLNEELASTGTSTDIHTRQDSQNVTESLQGAQGAQGAQGVQDASQSVSPTDVSQSPETPSTGTPDGQDTVIEKQANSQANSQASTDTPSIPSPSTASSSITPVPKLELNSIESFLSNLTDEQKAKLRLAVSKEGIGLGPISSGTESVKNPDGSMDVTVHLEPQIIEQLELWAESSGTTVSEEARIRITDALTNYLYGDWSGVGSGSVTDTSTASNAAVASATTTTANTAA